MYSIPMLNEIISFVDKVKSTEEVIIPYEKYIKMTKEERNSCAEIVVKITYNQVRALDRISLKAFDDVEMYIYDIPVDTSKQNLMETIEFLQTNDKRYFFAQPIFMVMNQEQMENMLELGVSQVFIGGEFCFDIDMIKYYSGIVKLRMMPNIITSSTVFYRKESFLNFFCRPEDIGIYEPYCTIQFSSEDVTRIPVLYEIYKARKWLGKIDYVITGITEDIDNNKLTLKFGEVRSRCCRNRCYKCHFCRHAVSLASTISELPISIQRKEKPIDEDTAYEKSVLLYTERPKEDAGESV